MQERMLGELLYYNHVKPAKKESAKCIKGKNFVIQDRRKGRRVNMQIDDNNRCVLLHQEKVASWLKWEGGVSKPRPMNDICIMRYHMYTLTTSLYFTLSWLSQLPEQKAMPSFATPMQETLLS